MKTSIRITNKSRLVVLTGAGISAESGVKTFRDSNGLWENHSIEDVATPEAFKRNPNLVWNFYEARYKQLKGVKPNPGHYALTQLEEYLGDNFLLITQNIDGLHQQAGSKNVLEMHGSIHNSYCEKCGKTISTGEVIVNRQGNINEAKSNLPNENTGYLENRFRCSVCSGFYRPDIIWFGEVPYHLDTIMASLKICTLFFVIGTSGVVYPAAQFLLAAKQFGAVTAGINLEPPENVGFIEEFHQGQSGQILPQLITMWLN